MIDSRLIQKHEFVASISIASEYAILTGSKIDFYAALETSIHIFQFHISAVDWRLLVSPRESLQPESSIKTSTGGVQMTNFI